LPEAMAKPGPCQVRINTCSPCTRHAEVEILGVAMCGPCARGQEAYFAIGELTQRTRGLRNKALADALKKIRRERVSRREGIAA
jgi:hypothetical protein